jgi:hypothetical protein
MPLLADRVRETSATTGTGTLTLAGAVAGYQGFNAAFANADTVYYVIQYATEWEVGIGTVGTGTLSRDSVLASSNADALVPFSAGTKDVFVAYVAERAVTTSDAATLTNKTIDDITNLVGADHIHYKIKANATITKGQTLKAVGYNAGNAAIEVVPISSASDIAVGIAYQDLASGAFGAAINTGLLIGVKTDFAGWALGDVLYPDPSTGGLTKTKPTSGTYQACAYIMRVQSNNGVLLCEFTEPQQVMASTNTANTAVLRDGSGNFAAGTVTAALTGNASTATALATARTINGVSFNGTADITVTAAAGTLSGATLAAGVTASSLTSVGTLGSLTVTNPITGSVTGSSGSTTGNAATATTLQTARNINGVSFNGSADITVTAAAGTLSGSTLASGVTASSLTSVGTLTSLAVSGAITSGATSRLGGATGPSFGVGSAFSSGQAEVYSTSTTPLGIGTVGAQPLRFYTDSGLRATIDSSGNVGIGTATPTKALHVRGDILSGVAAGGDSNINISTDGIQNTLLGFNNSGTTNGFGAANNFTYIGNGNAYGVQIITNGGAKATIDTSGNLGLGVTPSAWASDRRNMQIGSGASLQGSASDARFTEYGANFYQDSSAAERYITTNEATKYRQYIGAHSWYTAPSGTAGAAISFTQAMTLSASGFLGIGTTSPANSLQVGDSTGLRQIAVAGGGYDLVLGASGGGFFGFASQTISLVFSTSSVPLGIGTNAAQPVILGTGGLERARITEAGSVVVGTAALATSATDGFLYVPTCAGTPTGTPTTQTGTAPIIVDTTNHKLYFFSGGTWRDAGP